MSEMVCWLLLILSAWFYRLGIVGIALKLLAVVCVACDCFSIAQLCSCKTGTEMFWGIGLGDSLECTEWGEFGARQGYYRLVSFPTLARPRSP